MIDRKKTKRLTDEAARRSGRFRYLKKDATTILRVLEYQDKDGDTVFAQPLVEHRRQGQGGKSLGICREELFGKPCVFCRVNQIESDAGRSAPFISRTRYVVNAVDIENEPTNLRMWVLPVTVFNSIAEYALDDEWKDVLEAKTGFAFALKRSGAGLDTEYTTKPTRKAYPVNKNILSQVKDPIGSIRDQSLEDQAAQAGVDLNDIFDDTELSKIDSDGGEQPKKSSKKLEPKIHPEEPTIDVGSPVHYGDEEQVCHVVSIDGNDVTIEDPDGGKWDVSLDEISLADEGAGDGGEEDWNDGDRVEVEIDGDMYPGTIAFIKGDKAKVEFDDGDKQMVLLDELVEPDDSGDEPEETGDDEPAERPQCFGDGELYGENDDECKKCGFYEECGGNVELDNAGVGKSKAQAASDKKANTAPPKKKAKKTTKAKPKAKSGKSPSVDDDIVAGILG